MTTIWQSLRWLATGSAKGHTPFDEERLEWESTIPSSKRPKNHRRSLRLTRAAVWLFLIDLIIVALLLRAFEPLITLLRRNEELFGARVALSRDNALEVSNHPDRHRIPRILHQTCANSTIPEKWVESQQSCKEAYSDFEYKVSSLEEGYSPATA